MATHSCVRELTAVLLTLCVISAGHCMDSREERRAARDDARFRTGLALLREIKLPDYLTVMLSRGAVAQLVTVDTVMMAFCEKLMAGEEAEALRRDYIAYRDEMRPRLMAEFPNDETFMIAEALLVHRNMVEHGRTKFFEVIMEGAPVIPLKKAYRRHKGAWADTAARLTHELYSDLLGPDAYDERYDIPEYLAKASLMGYVGSGYKSMNKLLRYGISKETMSSGIVNTVSGAIRALNSPHYRKGYSDVFYRITYEPTCKSGVMGDTGRLNYGRGGPLAGTLQGRGLWVERAFLSTTSYEFSSSSSKAFENAVQMSHCGTTCNTIYQIYGQTARSVNDINPAEREFLFRPGTVFREFRHESKPSRKTLKTLTADGGETMRVFCMVYLEEVPSTDVRQQVSNSITAALDRAGGA